MRSRNDIINQKIALVQMRQAILLCYLQILRRFLIAHDAFDNTSITLPGGGKREFNYDAFMRTQAITGKDPGQNTLLNYSYGFDKMDNIKTRNTEAGNYAYNYDDLYRLNNVQKDANQTESYAYDQVGNRLTSAATTGDWTYNANNELLSYNESANQYDANGNTMQRNVSGVIQNFVYDVDNRLIQVKDGSNNIIATYTYDPFGRRIKKEIPSPLVGEGQGEGVTTYYLYSDEGLIGEYDSAGNEIKTYGYKPNSTWSTDPIFCHSRENGNSEYYFYHNDHLGTPQKMTDISGNVVWQASYDAFGKATINAASTITNNLRFPGQYYDAETGWHYNYHRYYDPKVGRFVTRDPIGFKGGINVFAYIGNNPMNKIDPLGLYETLFGPRFEGADAWPWYGGWPFNGSLWPGYDSQDSECSAPFGRLNKNPCTKKCCQTHDNCYNLFGCNESSWLGNILRFAGACQMCNQQAADCVIRNIGENDACKCK